MNWMEAMHIESLAPSRKDVAAILGNCKGCSKSGLHSFTYEIPYECFLHEQLCTEIQAEASAEFAIRGLHSRLNSLNIRLDNHKRAIITIEKCLTTINPERRATALWTCNTRRKAIAHLEARIQHDHRYLAIKHGIFAESRAAIIRIQNSIDKSEREQDPIDKELWQEEMAERFHESLMDKIQQADAGAYETEQRLDRSWHEGAASAASPMPFEQVRGTAQEDVQYRGMAGMVGLSLLQYTEEAAIKVEEEDFNPMTTIQSLFPKRTSAFAILGPCHGCGTSQTHTDIATFECSLFERLSAHMQADFEAESQMKFLKDKDIFLSLRLGQIRTDVLDLERKIGSETRGRAAAQRRRDELKREQEELEKLREEIKKALKTGEVNREVAILGAAEIEGDIQALHRISDRDEKDQWIRLRLARHVEEMREVTAQAEELFGPDWQERIAEMERGV
ncbi:hypothetical protein CGCVW01_v012988 [Colletotrichum viniferum]|nr:hypothetical protein CGCVW01_v012988 [Colletotrichum viniferum]